MFGRKKITTKKVLIVEDDSLLGKVLSTNFIEEKFDVMVVENGLEVLDNVKKFIPDIILLDLIIPGIDGFEVLKQLKNEDASKNIPVIVFSNLGEPSDIKSTKALGAEEYFIKAHYTLDDIAAEIKKVLSE